MLNCFIASFIYFSSSVVKRAGNSDSGRFDFWIILSISLGGVSR